MSGPERAALRRLIDQAARRQLGEAETGTLKNYGLPGAAWEAAGGDPLLALSLAVDRVRATAAGART